MKRRCVRNGAPARRINRTATCAEGKPRRGVCRLAGVSGAVRFRPLARFCGALDGIGAQTKPVPD